MAPEKVAVVIEKVLTKNKNHQIIGYRNWWMTQLIRCLPIKLRLKIVGNYIKQGRM
jgi:short-subunit dehydrogenase